MRNPLNLLRSLLTNRVTRLEVAPAVRVERPAAVACSSRRGVTRSPMCIVKAKRRTRPLLNADASVTIERNSFGHHYSHWNTMSVTIDYHGTETNRRDTLRDELQERIAEDVKQVSRELERQGYAALDVTDEMVEEHCEANEFQFTATGSLAPA